LHHFGEKIHQIHHLYFCNRQNIPINYTTKQAVVQEQKKLSFGMEFQVLKAIMGHSKLSITMDLYAHVLPDAKSKETQKISALFGV
jgi:hypothetical protein